MTMTNMERSANKKIKFWLGEKHAYIPQNHGRRKEDHHTMDV